MLTAVAGAGAEAEADAIFIGVVSNKELTEVLGTVLELFKFAEAFGEKNAFLEGENTSKLPAPEGAFWPYF